MWSGHVLSHEQVILEDQADHGPLWGFGTARMWRMRAVTTSRGHVVPNTVIASQTAFPRLPVPALDTPPESTYTFHQPWSDHLRTRARADQWAGR